MTYTVNYSHGKENEIILLLRQPDLTHLLWIVPHPSDVQRYNSFLPL